MVGRQFVPDSNNMQRFFFDDEQIIDATFSVSGEKYNHITRSLRMNVGEYAVFCDGFGVDYECELVSINSHSCEFKVVKSYENVTEPNVKITIYQCLPKGDKLDDMVKRTVQFGVYKIVPVLSSRCVSRPDSKSFDKKVERLNKISKSSSMQSMRGVVPEVCDLIDFNTAILQMKNFDSAFLCYESENRNLIDSSLIKGKEIAFLVGPEGGITKQEADFASENGILPISLGKRILRTEDASAFLIPIVLSITNNL